MDHQVTRLLSEPSAVATYDATGWAEVAIICPFDGPVVIIEGDGAYVERALRKGLDALLQAHANRQGGARGHGQA